MRLPSVRLSLLVLVLTTFFVARPLHPTTQAADSDIDLRYLKDSNVPWRFGGALPAEIPLLRLRTSAGTNRWLQPPASAFVVRLAGSLDISIAPLARDPFDGRVRMLVIEGSSAFLVDPPFEAPEEDLVRRQRARRADQAESVRFSRPSASALTGKALNVKTAPLQAVTFRISLIEQPHSGNEHLSYFARSVAFHDTEGSCAWTCTEGPQGHSVFVEAATLADDRGRTVVGIAASVTRLVTRSPAILVRPIHVERVLTLKGSGAIRLALSDRFGARASHLVVTVEILSAITRGQ